MFRASRVLSTQARTTCWWSTDHREGPDCPEYPGSLDQKDRKVWQDSQAGRATTAPSASQGRKETMENEGRRGPWEKRAREEMRGRRDSLDCPGSQDPLDVKWVACATVLTHALVAFLTLSFLTHFSVSGFTILRRIFFWKWLPSLELRLDVY